MWCALNCQAYRTPPYYPPLLYFARGFFSGIDPPALLCSPMGIAVFYIHPVFLLQATLCQMFHRGAKINLSVKQKLHFLSSWTNLAIFWGGMEHKYSSCSTSAIKFSDVDTVMRKPVSVEKVWQQRFILDSYAIDIAVMFLWLMAGDQTVIHIKAHDRFSVISSILWSLNMVIKDWEF